MASAIVNNRLEGHTRGTDLLPGLEAAVHDALWLLARQRQLGEFDGLDAGTPVSAAVVVHSLPITTWQPAGGQAVAYDRSTPLEALVEAGGYTLLWRDRVAAGLRLVRALRSAGVDPSALIKAYPTAVPDAAVAPGPSEGHATSAVTPDEVAAVGTMVAGRVPDPDAVAAAYDHDFTALITAVAGGLAAQAPLTAWREWWRSRTSAESGAWQPSELSYAFSASTSDGSVPVHKADRFPGGALDWYAFDVAPAPGGQAGGAPALPAPTRSIPSPITFSGAPADRYWQLDDARVDLGALDTYPTELAKLIVAEFTACFAGDWFRVPARVPYGSAVRIEALVSTDTFGVSTLVASAAADAGARPWRMYEHTAVSGTVDGSWLLIPSAAANRIASAPVEEVALARDPAADLAWGIEAIVANAIGRPVRRAEDLRAQGRVPAADPRAGLPGAWVWRLATSVPENWIPFLPTRGRAVDDDYLLVQGSMLRYDRGADGSLSATPILPAGRLLRDLLTLPEREIPREGLTFRWTRRLTRGLDGRRVYWWARTVAIGHGEASSGLAYDGLHQTSTDSAALGQ